MIEAIASPTTREAQAWVWATHKMRLRSKDCMVVTKDGEILCVFGIKSSEDGGGSHDFFSVRSDEWVTPEVFDTLYDYSFNTLDWKHITGSILKHHENSQKLHRKLEAIGAFSPEIRKNPREWTDDSGRVWQDFFHTKEQHYAFKASQQ